MKKNLYCHGAGLFAAAYLILSASGIGAQTICFEAEDVDAIVAPMRVSDGGDDQAARKVAALASGGKYLEVPEGAGKPPDVGGEAVYEFEIATGGRYRFWGRVWWPNSCGNSFTLILNDNPPFVFGRSGTYKHWHWLQGMLVVLQPGRHTLRVLNREDGPRMDQVLFTRNLRMTPIGVETVTGKIPE